MPVGVQVITAPASGGGDVRGAAAAFFVVGLTERGSVTSPTLVRSLAEAERVLGPRAAFGAVYDQLAAYFGEGGTHAYVARVVGDAATSGTLTLVDGSGGAGLPTLRVDAKSPGAWSSAITVEVTDDVATDSFRLTIRDGGEIVEQYPNLASPAAAAAAAADSDYVVVTSLGSVTAAPDNNPRPLAPTALSAGNDDRAAVVAADYVAALDRFGPDLGPGLVAIPGQAHNAVGAGLIAHAKANRRLAAIAPPAASTVTAAIAAANSLRNTTGNEHAGLFYPWVNVPDGAGGVRTISPEGYVAGVRARAIALEGTWRAPAGDIAIAQYVAGVETSLTRAELDQLVDANVDPIRDTPRGVRLYGWRSLSTDAVNYRFLNGIDVLNEIAFRAEDALERFVHRTIDGRGHLFAEVETALSGICEPIRAAGGLYEATDGTGAPVDSGYRVDTGPAVNTVDTIAAGQVRAVLAVRVSPIGELIRLTIAKVALGAAL